jgi:hypothetical protein
VKKKKVPNKRVEEDRQKYLTCLVNQSGAVAELPQGVDVSEGNALVLSAQD